jgi:hypothetical protein
MRNISFSLTTPQFIDGTKDVTRRLGWTFLKPGDHLMGCEKCQGIKPGELVRLGEIEVVSVRRECLNKITADDCRREGFPQLTPKQFVDMFCEHMACTIDKIVTRIEFKRVLP